MREERLGRQGCWVGATYLGEKQSKSELQNICWVAFCRQTFWAWRHHSRSPGIGYHVVLVSFLWILWAKADGSCCVALVSLSQTPGLFAAFRGVEKISVFWRFCSSLDHGFFQDRVQKKSTLGKYKYTFVRSFGLCGPFGCLKKGRFRADTEKWN